MVKYQNYKQKDKKCLKIVKTIKKKSIYQLKLKQKYIALMIICYLMM